MTINLTGKYLIRVPMKLKNPNGIAARKPLPHSDSFRGLITSLLLSWSLQPYRVHTVAYTLTAYGRTAEALKAMKAMKAMKAKKREVTVAAPPIQLTHLISSHHLLFTSTYFGNEVIR